MTSPYLRLTAEPNPREEDARALENALYRFNMATTNDWSFCRVAFFLRDDADRIHGGILGGIWGGWLHVNILWVAEGLRGQGFGSQLLAAAEEQARQKNCRGVFLETHSFQAAPFYKHRGYQVVGELPEYPRGHSYLILCKYLNGATEATSG